MKKKLELLGKLSRETQYASFQLSCLKNGKWKIYFPNMVYGNNLEGDDSEEVIDRAINFLKKKRHKTTSFEKQYSL
jgi:hypothetical protein